MKKLLTYSVVIATIVWSLGLAALVPAASAAYTPVAGDVIKTATGTAVYYIDSEGKRHLFSNEATFWTWKSGSWSTQGVKVISQVDFDALVSSNNVTARPGVNLIKFDNSSRVYAVSPGAVLSLIPSSTIAAALYGSAWASKVIVIQSAFENDYAKTGADLSSTLPNGSLIKYSGSDTIYYIDGGKKRAISGDAFVANKFKDSAIFTVSTIMTYETGTSITGQEAALTTIAGTGSVTPPVSGSSLSIALASDTPAAGIAVGSSIRVTFTTVSLTAYSDGDITVDTMTIERKGSAVDANFSTVALIDATTNVQIGVNQALNASSKAIFSDDVVVKAGTTKKIILAGNMAAGTAGQVPQLALSAIALKGTATVSGTLPITGNPMTITSLAIGTPSVARGTYNVSTSTDVKVGSLAYTIGAIKISADATEGQRVKQIKFYNSGTAALSDMSNYALYLDNATKINATFTADGKYLTADFTNSSVLVESGKTKEFVLKADITGGSTRTIKMSIYRTTDVLASGDTFGFMKTPTYSGAGSSAGNPVLTNDQLTISAGILRIESSSAVAAQNVSYGDGVSLGSFNFVVQGEDITITAITLSSSSSSMNSTNLDNVKLVEGTDTLWGPSTPASGAVAYTSSVRLAVGTHTLKVLGDLKNTGGFANNETFYFYITGSTVTATGATTGDAVSATPTGDISGSTMTFKPGKLTISANALPADGNVSLGAKQNLYGSWLFNASGSGEDVKVTAITIGNQVATTTNLDSVSLYDVTNKTNCTTLYPSATLDATYGCKLATKDGYSSTSTWTLSDPLVITKNTSVTLELRADVRSTAATYQGHLDEFIIRNEAAGTTAPVTAIGKSTGNTITPTGSGYNATDGADITIAGAGTLTVDLSSSNPASKILAEGQTYEIGRLKMTATNEKVKVSDLSLCLGTGALSGTDAGSNSATVRNTTNVKVYKSTDLTTPIVDGVIGADICTAFALADGALDVPTGSNGIELIIKATTALVDNTVITETGLTNTSFVLGIGGTDGITAKGENSGLTASETLTANTSSAMILHKSYPSIVINNDQDAKLASGAVLYSFTVNNPTAAPIAIGRLSFYTSTSSGDIGVTAAGLEAKLSSWSTYKKISADISTTTYGSGPGQYWSFVTWNPDSTSQTAKEVQIGSGESATFHFVGRTIVGLDGTAGESLQIVLLGDNASSTLNSAATSPLNGNKLEGWYGVLANHDRGVPNGTDRFAWSDLFENTGSTANGATTTAQWYNGYLVAGLEATSTLKTVVE